MARQTLHFYQKPGCITNRKQLGWLRNAGVRVEEQNLLTTVWTADSLKRFLSRRPVVEWFNPSAPAIKSGQRVPSLMSESEALDALCQDPLLIRRPLICIFPDDSDARHSEPFYQCGFDLEEILNWLGIATEQQAKLPDDPEACSNRRSSKHARSDLQAATNRGAAG